MPVTAVEIKKEIRELKAEMKANGIKKTSPFNGGLSPDSYRLNAERFRLETLLNIATKGGA